MSSERRFTRFVEWKCTTTGEKRIWEREKRRCRNSFLMMKRGKEARISFWCGRRKGRKERKYIPIKQKSLFLPPPKKTARTIEQLSPFMCCWVLMWPKNCFSCTIRIEDTFRDDSSKGDLHHLWKSSLLWDFFIGSANASETTQQQQQKMIEMQCDLILALQFALLNLVDRPLCLFPLRRCFCRSTIQATSTVENDTLLLPRKWSKCIFRLGNDGGRSVGGCLVRCLAEERERKRDGWMWCRRKRGGILRFKRKRERGRFKVRKRGGGKREMSGLEEFFLWICLIFFLSFFLSADEEKSKEHLQKCTLYLFQKANEYRQAARVFGITFWGPSSITTSEMCVESFVVPTLQMIDAISRYEEVCFSNNSDSREDQRRMCGLFSSVQCSEWEDNLECGGDFLLLFLLERDHFCRFSCRFWEEKQHLDN